MWADPWPFISSVFLTQSVSGSLRCQGSLKLPCLRFPTPPWRPWWFLLHREAGGSGGEPTPPAIAAAPTLGIHQRAPRRQSTKRGSAQPIISAFPFLASPNLAHGCCWRSKINQPRVIHRCLLFLSHFHLLFICRLCMMPRHYLLC